MTRGSAIELLGQMLGDLPLRPSAKHQKLLMMDSLVTCVFFLFNVNYGILVLGKTVGS